MPIEVNCACGHRLKAQDQHAGRKAKCPMCGQVLRVPLPPIKQELIPLAPAAPPAPGQANDEIPLAPPALSPPLPPLPAIKQSPVLPPAVQLAARWEPAAAPVLKSACVLCGRAFPSSETLLYEQQVVCRQCYAKGKRPRAKTPAREGLPKWAWGIVAAGAAMVLALAVWVFAPKKDHSTDQLAATATTSAVSKGASPTAAALLSPTAGVIAPAGQAGAPGIEPRSTILGYVISAEAAKDILYKSADSPNGAVKTAPPGSSYLVVQFPMLERGLKCELSDFSLELDGIGRLMEPAGFGMVWSLDPAGVSRSLFADTRSLEAPAGKTLMPAVAFMVPVEVVTGLLHVRDVSLRLRWKPVGAATSATPPTPMPPATPAALVAATLPTPTLIPTPTPVPTVSASSTPLPTATTMPAIAPLEPKGVPIQATATPLSANNKQISAIDFDPDAFNRQEYTDKRICFNGIVKERKQGTPPSLIIELYNKGAVFIEANVIFKNIYPFPSPAVGAHIIFEGKVHKEAKFNQNKQTIVQRNQFGVITSTEVIVTETRYLLVITEAVLNPTTSVAALIPTPTALPTATPLPVVQATATPQPTAENTPPAPTAPPEKGFQLLLADIRRGRVQGTDLADKLRTLARKVKPKEDDCDVDVPDASITPSFLESSYGTPDEVGSDVYVMKERLGQGDDVRMTAKSFPMRRYAWICFIFTDNNALQGIRVKKPNYQALIEFVRVLNTGSIPVAAIPSSKPSVTATEPFQKPTFIVSPSTSKPAPNSTSIIVQPTVSPTITANLPVTSAAVTPVFKGSTTAQGLWSSCLLSKPRDCLAATTVGTKSFFAGGYSRIRESSSSFDSTSRRTNINLTYFSSNVVDIYDSAAHTLSTATLSQARCNLTAIAAGTEAFFAGGYRGKDNDGKDVYSNVIDIYQTTTKTWSVATLQQARKDLSATSVGTKVFFSGGYGENGYSKVVDIYDSATYTFSTAELSQARGNLAAATVGTKALFAGGYGESGFSNVVDIYDSATNTWSTATLSQARSNLAATTVGTKAIFAGGDVLKNSSNVVDIYDSTTNTWSTATLSQARSNLAATSVGTKAFFAGGLANGNCSNVVDIYDLANNTWSKTKLTQSRDSLAATTAGNKAIFAGGGFPEKLPSASPTPNVPNNLLPEIEPSRDFSNKIDIYTAP